MINIEKCKEGLRNIRVIGTVDSEQRKEAISDDIKHILQNGASALKTEYIGVKQYSGFGDQRCDCSYGSGPTHYKNYGSKGITVCDRWKDYDNFLKDMGEKPTGKTLDRIKNEKGYSPDNCRWATALIQSRNRRFVRPLTCFGRTQLLTDWAKELGLNISTISMRLDYYGWSLERALGGKNV